MEQNEIYHLLRELGIGAHYRGYRYLAEAVRLAAQNGNCLLHATKLLYPLIAAQYGTTWRTVERDLRTVIHMCWKRGNRARLLEIAGYSLPKIPSTTAFIDLLVGYILKGAAKRN